MNNTIHTPGPWAHTKSREHSNPDTARRDIVAESQFGPAFIAGDVSQSDAALISAAPDLLAVIVALLPHAARAIQGTTEGQPLLDAARAAIAKAKGEA